MRPRLDLAHETRSRRPDNRLCDADPCEVKQRTAEEFSPCFGHREILERLSHQRDCAYRHNGIFQHHDVGNERGHADRAFDERTSPELVFCVLARFTAPVRELSKYELGVHAPGPIDLSDDGDTMTVTSKKKPLTENQMKKIAVIAKDAGISDVAFVIGGDNNARTLQVRTS
jgi:hypothetical protein